MNFYEQIFSRGRATGEGMTHFERLFAAKFGGPPPPEVREYTGPVPVTITADGTPLLDLLISGNEEHTGAPTPDNPIMPQGTGDKTANLFDIENVTHETLGTDGSVSFESAMNLSELIRVDGDYTVSWSAVRSGAYMRVSTYDENKNFIARIVAQNTYTRSSYSNTHTGYIRINYENSYQLSDIMLNTGSTALPFEPFGVKIPISSADTTTPVYLGEVESTRKIKKYEFTGTETFSKATSTLETGTAVFSIRYDAIGMEDIIDYDQPMPYITYPFFFCSHFVMKTNTSFNTPYTAIKNGEIGANSVANNTYNRYVVFASNQYNTVDTFQAFLAQQYAAGTPVTVWYVLATEETGIVNEPLMKIGTYADTLSKAQAGVAIPTNNGSTTVDVDTTLKPSEVYIKYMG